MTRIRRLDAFPRAKRGRSHRGPQVENTGPPGWAASDAEPRPVDAGGPGAFAVEPPACRVLRVLPGARPSAVQLDLEMQDRAGLDRYQIYVDGVPKDEREVLIDFIEESYRTIAPKKLVKQLDQEVSGST